MKSMLLGSYRREILLPTRCVDLIQVGLRGAACSTASHAGTQHLGAQHRLKILYDVLDVIDEYDNE